MPAPARRNNPNEIVLPPVHANLGIEADYRRRLQRLIKDMADSVDYWVRSGYKNNPPATMAEDDLSANFMGEAIKALAARWLNRFDTAAEELADYFATAVQKRSDARLKSILKKGGFAVKFKMTRSMRDAVNSTIEQNVALIKSIPAQYLTNVQGAVMRSIQTGRDLGPLTKELEKTYGVTHRRAALIARTQNNMATASMTRARQLDLGITKARWQHSHGGNEPRPTHLKASNDRVEYDIQQGWYDPHVGRYIQPGELINCKCSGRPIVKGF